MSDPFVAEEFIGSITVLRFCRPAQRNTLSAPTLDRLAQLFTKIESTSPSAVILTGMDDVFLSGADINELTQLDQSSAKQFSQRGQLLTDTIAGLNAVTSAAINGYCMGGGLDFALACDIRVASKSAVFAHPGARLGIITGWGGTQRLPRLIGRARAIELFATGRRVDAEEALDIGLVSKVEDPVLDFAIDLAQRINSTS